MPAYLSEGSNKYNQLRKIQPCDIVGQLGYYLPPDLPHSQPTSSSSNQSFYSVRHRQRVANVSTKRRDVDDRDRGLLEEGGRIRRRSDKEVSPDSPESSTSSPQSSAKLSNQTTSASSSCDVPTLSNYMQFQKRFRKHAKELGHKLGLDPGGSCQDTGLLNVTSTASNSPANSSGFSDGTNAGASIVEIYPKQPSQLQLNDASHAFGSSRGSSRLPQPITLHQQHVSQLDGLEPEVPSKERRSVGFSPTMARSMIRVNGRRNKIGRLRRPSRANRFRGGAEDEYNSDYINPYALSELFSQSEIPGFREIFASDSYLRKFCWIVAFLFMTILSLNDMTELITEYYEYPITVDVRLRDSARLPFPAVTVCNLNVVRFSSLCSSSNAHFDLTNQIPSELRDKLCGIQVEKKNTSDTDIGDINNIGIFTTTTLAPTAIVPASDQSVENSSNTLGSTTHSSEFSSTIGSVTLAGVVKTTAPAFEDEIALLGHKNRPKSVAAQPHSNTKQNHASSLSSTSGPNVATTPIPATVTHAPQSSPQTSPQMTTGQVTETATSPVASTKRTTAKGSLDLDDFIEPSMLQQQQQPEARQGQLAKRSIRGSDANLRPFASTGSRIQLPTDRNPNWPPTQQQSSKQQHQTSSLSTMSEGTHSSGGLFRRNSATLVDRITGKRNKPAPLLLRPPVSSVGGNPIRSHSSNGIGSSSSSSSGSSNNNNANSNNNNENHGPIKLVIPNSIGNQSAPPQSPQSRPSQSVNITTFTLPPALMDDFEITERQERELQENLTNWLAVMYNREPSVTRTLGHQFDDMILRCTMKSINCTRQKSFESSFSPTEGNCFTYRSRIKRRHSFKSGPSATGASQRAGTKVESVFEEANLAGTNDGLELVLNLEKNEYIAGSSQVGALVMIHHPNDLGYAASEATFIAPEFTTYIGLKMVNITRLPAPYPESCVDSWPAKFADALVRNSTYSQQTCLKICLQKTIQTHCQCQSAFLPIVELDGNSAASNTPTQLTPNQQTGPLSTTTTPTTATTPTTSFSSLASQSNPTTTTSMPPTATATTSMATAMAATATTDSTSAQMGQTTLSNTTLQAPPMEATTTTTTSKPSTTTTPIPQQRIIICDTRRSATRQCVKEVMFRAADRVHNCECPPKCQVIRYDKTISMARWPTREDKVTFDRGKADVNFQNLAKVIVYFQTMTCEEVTQQAVFNAAKLFSALGGIMGMYVGFSFLSVFEIFEVMSRKVWHYVTLKFISQQHLVLPGARISSIPINGPQESSPSINLSPSTRANSFSAQNKTTNIASQYTIRPTI